MFLYKFSAQNSFEKSTVKYLQQRIHAIIKQRFQNRKIKYIQLQKHVIYRVNNVGEEKISFQLSF